ncbi:MAG TPA: CoA-binding protein, partial [Deltaproteobacteria bacterium]|nr:CoA-binding protein [Deltaproteobacteria bacterium]
MRLGDTVDEPTSSAQDVVKAAGPFVHPETLALIGATSRGDKVGNRILQYLAGWQGRLFLVSRNESEIMGRPACRDIADLPDSIDLAVIAVEARKAVEAAKRCADKNFRAVIIPASGFSETGTEGERLEEELRQRVSAKGTRVLGPNTLGVFIPGTGLDTVFVEHGDRMFAEPGESVFITQSGSVGIEALGVSGVIGWGLKAFIGLGNRIDMGENEFIEYFARDHQARSIALYLETFQDGGAFIDICRRTTPVKPVIVLKAGRSEEALHAVASHTGKMSSPAEVFTGAARQAGIILAQNEEQLTDFAKILSREPPVFDPGVAVVTFAGGYGIITLDLIADTEHLFPARLSERTVSRIRQSIPAFASADNPVDLTASADNGMMERTLQALEDDPNVGIIFCIAFFAPPRV